jgi:hypothetical protein
LIKNPFKDLDLKSAYSTAMSLIDYPDYQRIILVNNIKGDIFMKLFNKVIFKTYSSFEVKFSFPKNTNYPNFGVHLDSNLIFPLEGRAYVTGLELKQAIEQMNCNLEILEGVIIP